MTSFDHATNIKQKILKIKEGNVSF